MRALSSLTLRSRVLVLVLVGAVIPLGIAGSWLADSARRSGEELVRERLNASLEELVLIIGKRWTVQRSTLLDLGDARAIRAALHAGIRLTELSDDEALAELERVWWKAMPVAAAVIIRDTAQRMVADLPTDLDLAVSAVPDQVSGVLLHRLRLYTSSGDRLGYLEVAIRVRSLLPSAAGGLSTSGATLVLRDLRTGELVLPIDIDPDLLSHERFAWEGDTWLEVERRLDEPPLRIALASPVGALAQSLREATRRGTVVLAVVALVVVVMVVLFARQLTGSLLRLSRSATSVLRGDLSSRAEESGPPEVVRTARALNAMTESLSHTLQRLSQQEAVAAVGEFAASLAHEVRNPLSAIQVDLQRSRRKLNTDSGEAVQLVDRALVEIDRLNKSVSDFLRIARSGRVTFARVDLRTPLEAAARAAKPRFDGTGAILEYLPPEGPVWVAADPSAIEQLVLNLLLNAADVLQCGERAELRLDVRPTDVLVAVWDEGPGIPPYDVSQVFQPFFTTKEDGTGLGLSVARRIALAHGSDLQFESTPSHGTTFSLALPLASTPSGTTRSLGRSDDAPPGT